MILPEVRMPRKLLQLLLQKFSAITELKFSLLILHTSPIAVLAELIIQSAFSLAKNNLNIFMVKNGKRRLRFAEKMTSNSQNIRVGIATSTIEIPIK